MTTVKIVSKLFKYAFAAILCYVFIFAMKLVVVFPWTAQQLYFSQVPEQVGLIVFLDGEYKERVNHAFELYEAGYSKKMFSPNIEVYANKKLVKSKLKKLGNKVKFYQGPVAASTYEEALITKDFIDKHNISSMILVTSPYHSYRANWIFNKVMPDIRIVSCPVPMEKSWFKIEKIEKNNSHYRIFRSEQLKFLGYYLKYSLGINFDRKIEKEIKNDLSSKNDLNYIHYFKRFLDNEISKE
ncbi:MAG TPA: hypothetical protein DCS13_05375 [Candidatus Margulisbacteria bacterium]|nr:MAG: hypothetical protein A2X43_10600 [Candidatus Margulisbacteria bacterium GWD2_39_127]HAR62878.1 hypothetical protein [Candidatus Margulisiibacteriota bacterium]